MALKRADIRKILENAETSNDDKAKAILDALHKETDELKDQLDAEKTARTQAEKERDEAADQDGDHHDETDALYRFVGELAYAPHRTRNEDARYGRQETDREEQEIGFHGGYVRLSRSAWN